MVTNRVNEAGMVAVMRLSHAARQLRHRGVIRKGGFVLLVIGLAGLAPQAIAQSFPAAFELRSLLPEAGGDGTAGFVLKGVDSDDFSGWSVSNAGDVNGDGIDDLIIGARDADPNGRSEAGESYVVYGRTTGFPATFELRSLFPEAGGDGTVGFVLKGIDANDRSGYSVSGAGDVNGDGIDDLIVGALEASPNGVNGAGESYLVFGRTTGFPAAFELRSLFPEAGGDGTTGFVLKGIDADDESGFSVSNAGDVNGDGIDDLIIGARLANAGGESYVVFGRNTGFPATFELRSLFPVAGGDGTEGFALKAIDAVDQSGISVSNAGDVNGDGIDDLIIGASSPNPNGKDNAGESYVVFGRNTGFPAAFELTSLLPPAGGDGTEGFVLGGIDPHDHAGGSVSNAGDVNGDGIDDLLIGAEVAVPHGASGAGESYVVFGRTTGFPAAFQLFSLFPEAGGDGTEGFVLKGIGRSDFSGNSVSNAGDVNGDGIDDLIIGASGGDPNGRASAGESYVVFGRTTGFPAAFELRSLFPEAGGDGTGGFVLKGIDTNDSSGWSVSSAGDVNGDGIDDLIIGARFADPNGESEAGESYVVFGRAP